MGRRLKTSLLNLGLCGVADEVLRDYSMKLDNIYEQEPDAGLVNGGLGRLAACYLDGMATDDIPVSYTHLARHLVDDKTYFRAPARLQRVAHNASVADGYRGRRKYKQRDVYKRQRLTPSRSLASGSMKLFLRYSSHRYAIEPVFSNS